MSSRMLDKSVIIEGNDGMGKSVLARALAKHFQCGIFLIGGPPSSDDVAEYITNTQIHLMRSYPVVFDRATPISRLCYEKHLSEMHQELLLEMMDEIIDYATIIWCKTDSPIHVPADHDTPEHLARIEEDKELIDNNYATIMGMIPHIKYDYKTGNIEELYNVLCRRN